MQTKLASYAYKVDFFDFVDRSSGRSANALLPLVFGEFEVGSILDVGCGRGIWLSVWRQLGIQDIQGVDGTYVDQSQLHIATETFKALDISAPFSLGRVFDLVQCLEVAEHVEESRSSVLIDNLVSHGDLILFSAAIPGQGGEHHVNEQPLGYWVERFRQRKYEAYDCVRPLVSTRSDIEPWYRYNTLVFATSVGAARLTEKARARRVAAGTDLSARVPIAWKLRCQALRALPNSTITALAKMKHRLLTSTSA